MEEVIKEFFRRMDEELNWEIEREELAHKVNDKEAKFYHQGMANGFRRANRLYYEARSKILGDVK